MLLWRTERTWLVIEGVGWDISISDIYSQQEWAQYKSLRYWYYTVSDIKSILWLRYWSFNQTYKSMLRGLFFVHTYTLNPPRVSASIVLACMCSKVEKHRCRAMNVWMSFQHTGYWCALAGDHVEMSGFIEQDWNINSNSLLAEGTSAISSLTGGNVTLYLAKYNVNQSIRNTNDIIISAFLWRQASLLLLVTHRVRNMNKPFTLLLKIYCASFTYNKIVQLV